MEQDKEKYLRIFDFSAMDINRLNGASLLGDAITFGLALLEFEQKNQTDQKEAFTASLDFDRELIQLFLNLQTEWTLHDCEEVESFLNMCKKYCKMFKIKSIQKNSIFVNTATHSQTLKQL